MPSTGRKSEGDKSRTLTSGARLHRLRVQFRRRRRRLSFTAGPHEFCGVHICVKTRDNVNWIAVSGLRLVVAACRQRQLADVV